MDKARPVIVNLNSGTAKAKYAVIKSKLDKKYTFEVTSKNQFKAVYDRVLKLKPDVVVLAGGDGTIIKGIESLLHKGYKGAFAILPFGTANYLARELNISLKPKDALKQIENGKPISVPLAKLNDKYFALMMSIGITRSVSSNVEDKLKQKIGQFAYVAELFRQNTRHDAFSYEMITDTHVKPITGKSHQILIYNADMNQQVTLVPKQSIKSKKLKVVIFHTGENLLRLYTAVMLHVISFGKIKKYMKSFEAEKIEIVTSPKQKAGLDGEVVKQDDFVVEAAAVEVQIVRLK